MMLLQALFAWRIMPETKGLSLEALQHKLHIADPGGGTAQEPFAAFPAVPRVVERS